MQPLVSVIVPNYNHAKFLKQRIDSILGQTYDDYELIILDDCSTDNSKDIIELYRNNLHVAHIAYNEKNSGSLFSQWRKGLSLAKGEWIWIAESDDYCETEFLKRLISKANNGVSLVFCQSDIVDENEQSFSDSTVWLSDLTGQTLDHDFVMDGTSFFYGLHAYKNIVSNTSSVIFRKKNISKIFFPDDYKMCGDWLFFAQMSLLGKVAYVSEPLNHWRQHARTTRNIGSLDLERLRLKENMNIVRHFTTVAKNDGRNLELSKYDWIVDRWLRQFTYRNMLKWKYLNPPIPCRMKLKFHIRLIKRFKTALFKSLKKRLFK